MHKILLFIFALLCSIAVIPSVSFGAPPDDEIAGEEKIPDIEIDAKLLADSSLKNSERLRNMAESLVLQGIDPKRLSDSLLINTEKLQAMAESLAVEYDSLNRLSIDFDDYADLPSFSEIIIDQNGTIKVRTDSGMVVIPPDSFLTGTNEPAQREITRWGQNIIVDEGEQLVSDIVLIGGDVTVNGSVEGDVVVIGGNIYVNDTGYIRGDATAIGGKVKKEEGAKVTGTTMAVSVPFMVIPRGSVFQIIQGILILIMVVSLFFSALAISLLPRPIVRISTKLAARPIKSFFFGYLSYLGVGLIWLLLLVSIIGIPLALIGEPIAFLVLIVFSYAAFNLALGEKVFKEKMPVKAFFYGCLITSALPFLLMFLGFLTDSLALFIINMILLSFLLFIILPFGFGAAFMARFGFPPRVRNEEDPENREAAPDQAD